MKKQFAAILLFLLFIDSTGAAQPAKDTVVHTRQVYKTLDTGQLIAHVFYTPSTLKKKNNAALAFFHGGGWAFGKPEEFFGACRRYAQRGLVAVSFSYRLVKDTSTNPDKKITPIDCVIDARSALRWLRSQAKAYHLDPNKIVAGGQSVGGQLALATAMLDTYNDPQDDVKISPVPNAIISWSGTVNTIEPWCDLLLGHKRNKIHSISPAHNLKAGLPPVIAFHGSADTTVPFWTVAFFARDTEKLGNHFELHKLEGRKHYLGEGNARYATLFDEEILLLTDDFLSRFGFMNK